MTKSTPTLTLTQSGLLALLLQRQRYAVIQLAGRHAHRQHMRTAFWSALTWPWRALTAPRPNSAKPLVGTSPHLNLSPKLIAGAPQIHTYTKLRQQIHDDLRIQHPEWVERNGESSMRLMDLLDTMARRGSNESIAAAQRAIEQGAGR